MAAGYSDVARATPTCCPIWTMSSALCLTVPRAGQPAPARRRHRVPRRRTSNSCVVQEDGPFQVAGYNVGGIVAYEVAQRILCVGDQVAALI
ncbi:MAG: thioesterase domain-containing protein [Caldilineaceae bacterium]